MIYICECDKGEFQEEERFTKEVYVHNEMMLKKYYKARHIEGLSGYTLEHYLTYLRVFGRTIGKRYEDMNTNNIRDFLIIYQSSHNMTNYSMDGIRIIIKTFYDFLVDEDYINKNPATKIKKIKYDKNVKVPFTDEEMVRIKDSCKNIKERALIDLLYSTGCRVSEIVGMDIEDVDFDTREILVYGKGSKERIVYFDASTKVHLEKYLYSRKDNNSALFVQDKSPHGRMERSGIEWLVKDIGKRCGIKKCYPHKFRRTIATRLLEKGMPIEEVKEFLGHENINTTLVYAKINKNSVKYSHKRLLA